jgi:hypothetical protein
LYRVAPQAQPPSCSIPLLLSPQPAICRQGT